MLAQRRSQSHHPLSRPLALVLVAAPLVATGCGGHLMSNLAMRELIVEFQPSTTQAARVHVLHSCEGYPNATPEPVASSKLESVKLNDIRYRIDNASDVDLANLEACLAKFPSVVGVHDTSQDMH